MMNRLKWILFICTGLITPQTTNAQTSTLFAGNSYTYYNDMPETVKKLTDTNGVDCEVVMSVQGGVSLKDHWEGNAGLETKGLIENGSFDFVILQDQSLMPINNPISTLTYGKKLAELAEESGGRVFILQTWSRKSNPDSQIKLDSTFLKLAVESCVKIVPVANAWHLAMKEYPDLKLYDPDGSHPSEIGSYLTALVIYRTLFEVSGSENYKTFISKRLPLSDMKKCEWVARQVVE